MALNLCYVSSPSLFDPKNQCHFLSPSKRLQLTAFPSPSNALKLILSSPPHTRPLFLNPLHVNLQDPSSTTSSNPQLPDAKPISSSGSPSNNSVWVNPNSPRARLLRKSTYNARYSFLIKIARSLNSCDATPEAVSTFLEAELGGVVSESDAMAILDNTSNAETALLAFRYFQGKIRFEREVNMYNVLLKVMMKRRDLNGAEKLFDEMTERGIAPNNVTFCTIITCARLRSLPGKCVEWFEKMVTFSCYPDDVTYSAMIDVYGRIGDVGTALSLYDRARSEKWRVDLLTFCTVIKIYKEAANFDGCLNVYQEMRALGVKPNLYIYKTVIDIYLSSGNFDGCLKVHDEMKTIGIKPSLFVYNKLLDAMGRAKRPWKATSIYKEMIYNGVSPNWATYGALLHAYCRARYGEDAVKLYRMMKEKRIEINNILYNMFLAMCADFGYCDEADEAFQDMKGSGTTCKPDAWTFSSMISVFSSAGNVEKVETLLNEMLEAGFQPDIIVLTSLVQCYGKVNRTDDVLRTYSHLIELGLTPDEKFCACLLYVSTQMPTEELPRLLDCITKANSELGFVVKLLLEGEDTEGTFRKAASRLLDNSGADVKKAICNCLIDLCVNLNLGERARELMDLGFTLGMYSYVQSRTPIQWSLNLKSLSSGAALTALHIWINDLSKVLESGKELPSILGINMGNGKHKFANGNLVGVLSHLKELNAPFHETPDKDGWFLTTKAAANSWLEGLRSKQQVLT